MSGDDGSEIGGGARTEPGGAKVPVLLVDDTPGNLLALEAVLSGETYDLRTARSGRDAIRQVEQHDFAVVLLDAQMPELNGFETAARLKEIAHGSVPVPIIFVTGLGGDPVEVLRAYTGGAVDFIEKPFVREAVRAKVAVFASLYQARRRLLLEQQKAARAVRMLSDLALALSEARAPAEVAAAVVDQGTRAAHADTCSVYLLDEERQALELLGCRGVSPELVEKTRRLTEANDPFTFADLRTGATRWVETLSDYARLHPDLANDQARRVRAFFSVPLIVEGRGIGLLGMGFYEERRFPPDERLLVETIAKQCAQALLRAVRLEREDLARAALTTTLRSIGDAVIATDTRGRITFMNGVAEELTGWREADGRGRALEDVFQILSEATRRASESPVAKVLREGKVVGLANHTILRTRSGKEIPIDDSAAPIRDANGVLFGVVLVFRDVTTEKREYVRRDFLARAGAALASSLDYRTTLATVSSLAVPQLADWCTVSLLEPGAGSPQQVAVAHADPQKVAWARDLGERYPPDPDAITGAPQVIRSGKSELYPEIPTAMLEAGARDAEHLRIIRELRLESAMVVPLCGHDRTLGAMTFIYADSGRRYTADDLAFAEDFARRAAMAIENALAIKQAEQARAEERLLRREADLANRAKDEFLATVSHELRTPLNAILGWTLTLRGRHPAAEMDHALAIIERNARRQARLIEDVLDMSRIISGKLSLNVEAMSVAEAIDGAIESVAPAADAKQVTIRRDIEAPFTIRADAGRLQQVIWNLLVNAVKFTPKGGEVSVRVSREGSHVCIDVSDTGEGISFDALPHIFEPFRQADASTTRRHGGLGLGLAIVKQLVTAHGGTVQARSAGLGLGATFLVLLPVGGAGPMVSDSAPPMATATNAAALAIPRLDGLSVLLVDDEEDSRDVVDHMLRAHGASVMTASSAVEALGVLPRGKPDVIVSDIGMPDIDGYAFIRKVRLLSSGEGGRTPAVALTAYARKDDAQRAFAAGFQMHLAKPVEPMQLVRIVANVAGRSLGDA